MLDAEILDKISLPRLDKYKEAFGLTTYEHAYAVYVWNKMLAGAFTPLVQSVEVSLRNAINQGIMSDPKYGWLWFTNVYRPKDLPGSFAKLHHHIVNKFTHHDLDILKENGDASYAPILKSTYDKKIKKGAPSAKRSYNQHIIGNLMLGSWVVLLNSDYVDNTHKTRLWPNLTSTVFPNAVGAEKDNLFHIYNNVRLFRNRISHNEPLCRAATVAATQQINDSIEFLSEKYQELLHALGLISRKRQQQINDGPATSHFYSVCNKEYVNRLIDSFTTGRLRVCGKCKKTYTTSTGSTCPCRI
ncbi:Abi family protein [Pantoea agglomerans]|uniref:Abi family protein n=1 Tax=Enterobacter agglomerans TaxID=549 RepID=UPI0032095F38